MTRPRTSATAFVGLALLGVLLGLVGSVVASGRSTVGDVVVPWGAALMIVAVPVVVRAAVWQAGVRTAGAAVLGGWLLATAAVLSVSPGGDVLLPDTTRSWVYIGGCAALGLLALVWRVPTGLAELVVAEQGPPEHVPTDGDVLPGLADTGRAATDASGEPDGVR